MSELYLEKLALGELSAKEKERLDARMTAAEQVAAVARIEAENAGLRAKLGALPAGREESRAWATRARVTAPLLAMAAAIALYVLVRPAAPPEPDVILKGSAPRLHVYRKSAETVERLGEDAAVRAGDLLQLRYTAGGATHGVILSLDGAGHVTLHFPESANASTALTTGRETALPFAFELDDAPKFERFVFITGPSALPVAELVARAEALSRSPDAATSPLSLPEGLTQVSHVVRRIP